jgi:hypothetical protein
MEMRVQIYLYEKITVSERQRQQGQAAQELAAIDCRSVL